MIVSGAVLDARGFRRAYVRFRHGRAVEVGQPGTESAAKRERRVTGIVLPAPVDGHTHLGDAVSGLEPPHLSVEEIVAPPNGLKFRLLSQTPAPRKRSAMRRALQRLQREGVAATLDFREEGLAGVELLRLAADGLPVRPVIFGRPLRSPPLRAELDALLDAADGIGLSSAADVPRSDRDEIARRCRARRKFYGLHASEVRRELPEEYLSPRPDLLVHLIAAEPEDLEQVVGDQISVAVCPRSNALFHRRPPLRALEQLGARVLLGTDNAMFQAPSLLRELEFAYLSARQADAAVTPDFLVRAAFIEPWRFLGEPKRAVVGPDGSADAVAFRLPPDDPAYQVVARATEHLMFRPRAGSTRSAKVGG